MTVSRGTPPWIPADLRVKLDAFADLLGRWNTTVNLIGRQDLPHLWDRHILDSLQLLELIPPAASHGIDLGSGAGFPGLILSLAAGIPFTLIDSDHRKCAFLREAARVTCAMIDVRAVRMELVDDIQAPLVTARGVGPLAMLLPTLERLLASGGSALLPRGANAGAELAAVSGWSMTVRRHDSRMRDGSKILEVRDITRDL